jgi:hypothetical protein
MKCEECLPLVEEYVDGELNKLDTEQVTAHLSTCAACAQELEELTREQEIYASYQRDVEITPAMWNIVRARIEDEKAARPASVLTRLPVWLAVVFGTRLPLRNAFAAAVVLVALGITTIGLIRYFNRGQQEAISQTGQTPQVIGANGTGTPGKAGGNDLAVIPAPTEKLTPDNQPTDNLARQEERKKAFLSSSLPRPNSRRTPKLMPDEPSQFVEAVENNIAANISGSTPQTSGDPEMDIARHVEKAQMLLRSFRNVRLAETSHAPDIAYEKEQSRKLLYRNITLRREAAARGNAPVEKMLNQLEPILLDIANLPDRATARDVRSIERRMQQKEIVAALQVHSLIATNSY